MSPSSFVIAVAGLTAALAAPGQNPVGHVSPSPLDVDRVEIQSTGSLHGDEVSDGAEGPWLALVTDGGGAALQPVTAWLTPEQDLTDEDGQETGRRVEISPPLDPIVLLRGHAFTPGHVPTALLSQYVDTGRDLTAMLNGVASRLSVRCEDAPRVDEYRRQQCPLTITSSAGRQTLFTYTAAFDAAQRVWSSEVPPTVLWAGDLDADGALDILLDTSESSNENEVRLFLSSAATGAQLVSEVARFTHVGC